MISKHEMMNPILKVSPSFQNLWNEFLEEWKDDKGDLPIYLALSDLARHIASLISEDKEKELKNIFEIVEKWHVEGEEYVKEAATVGLLENLQNTNIVGKTVPGKIETYLFPESKRYWKKLYDFWEKNIPISDN